LVRRVGDEAVPPAGESLGIAPRHLATVHAALSRVVTEGFGKERGLLAHQLGFTLAAKTGSADYRRGMVPPSNFPDAPSADFEKGMRKHTWLAGWFPAEAPRFVITVYVHDTSATASHSAAYVARKFLRSSAVQQLMARPVGGGR
ncbi:MAG: penicillin-binding transpeptidase domain-containing protein, partial [Planctomycetota bacterium]|nr:penicillin-binding transpeptidase domain-containing protein [Planctomycetota bacterium]